MKKKTKTIKQPKASAPTKLFQVVHHETGVPVYPGKGTDEAQAYHLGRGLINSREYKVVPVE